jgi:hypothetical protein
VTAEADAQLMQLREDTPYFRDEADVYRVAVAIALARRSVISETLRRAPITTKFRTFRTDLDPDEDLPRLDTVDRRLARLVQTFFPEAVGEPYRFSMWLATIGISYLHGELIGRGRRLTQVIDDLSGSAGNSDA